MSAYFLVLSNTFLATLLLPARAEYAWFAAQGFGRPDMPMITALAVAGATLAMILNYGLGYWIAGSIISRLHMDDAIYKRVRRVFRFVVPLLLVPQFPFAPLVAAFSGIFRIPFLVVIAVVVLGRIGYYGYYMFQP